MRFPGYNFSVGSSGHFVRYIQQRLEYHGFDLPVYGIDGIFGDETRTAVLAFQRSKGLKIDGIVGPETWPALAADKPAPVVPDKGTDSGTDTDGPDPIIDPQPVNHTTPKDNTLLYVLLGGGALWLLTRKKSKRKRKR